jgi:hypothetical protein
MPAKNGKKAAPQEDPAPKAKGSPARGKKRSAPDTSTSTSTSAATTADPPAPAPAPAPAAPAAAAGAKTCGDADTAAKGAAAAGEPPAKRQQVTVPPRAHEVTVLLPIDAVGLIISKVN